MRLQPRLVPLCLIPALVIFLSMSSTASAIDLTSDLVLHYTFDYGSDTNKAAYGIDSSGNSYNATVDVPDRISGGTGATPNTGNSIHLDSNGGADTGRLVVNSPSNTVVPSTATPSSALTLATWVNIDVLCDGMDHDNEETVFGSQSQNTSGGVEAWGVKLRIDGERRDSDGDSVKDFEGMDYNYGLYNSAGECFLWAKIEKDDQGNWLPEMCEGEWMHIAVTYDAATDSAAIYLDGVKHDFSSAINTTITDRNINPVWDWATIGTYDPTVAGNRPYMGYMDDFRIYDRCLNDAEVGALAEVPEPSTMIMLLGLAVAAFAIKRK